MGVLHNMYASRLLLLRLQRTHGQYCYPMPAVIVEDPLAVYYRADVARKRALDAERLRRALVRCISPVLKVRFAVCYEFGVTEQDLTGPSRKAKYVLPRQVAMYLAQRHSQKKESEVARFFNKDPTCVREARKKISARVASDAMLARRVSAVEALLAA